VIGACLLCGEPVEDADHITGRDVAGRYLDPPFIAGVCHSCHELAEDDRRTAGVADGPAGETFLDSLEQRLTRAAMFLGRVAVVVPGPLGVFLAKLARSLADWAHGLALALGALDRYSPGWRTIPGV
jgi:hypothetical protein